MTRTLPVPGKQAKTTGRLFKRMGLTALCLTIGVGLDCRAEGNETKGLFREQPAAVNTIQTTNPQDSGKPNTTQSESMMLRGSVQKQFPSPDDVLEVDDKNKGGATTTQLEAIISTTSETPFDRLMKKGNDALVQYNLQVAENEFTSAIHELKKTGAKDLRLAKARNAVASVLLREGKLVDAKETYELALKTATENQSSDKEASKALLGLAGVAKANGEYKKAEQLFKNAITTRRKATGDIDPGMAQILLDLGELYRVQKLYPEGEPVYQLALDTLNKSPDVPDLTKAYFLDKSGMFFQDQAKMPEARKCFAMALDIKDRYSTLYMPVDANKRGLVYYRCENGIPNAARIFSRTNEIEYLHVKDVVAVATLSPQEYSADWYLLKAEVTIQNQGKTAISACSIPPTLTIELPKRKMMTPLDSEAIAAELGFRGSRLYNRLLHSADYAYTLSSFGPGINVGAFTPFGLGVFATVGGWTSITPDWGARIAARNAAVRAFAGAISESNTVLATKPSALTIGPGESATFQVFYPYNTFDTCTLRFLVGNTVMEFPFTYQSG